MTEIKTVRDIHREIAKTYDQHYDGLSMQRHLYCVKSYCAYDRLGCILFALNGSPPKGYALFVPAHRYVLVIDAWGNKRKHRAALSLYDEIKHLPRHGVVEYE